MSLEVCPHNSLSQKELRTQVKQPQTFMPPGKTKCNNSSPTEGKKAHQSRCRPTIPSVPVNPAVPKDLPHINSNNSSCCSCSCARRPPSKLPSCRLRPCSTSPSLASRKAGPAGPSRGPSQRHHGDPITVAVIPSSRRLLSQHSSGAKASKGGAAETAAAAARAKAAAATATRLYVAAACSLSPAALASGVLRSGGQRQRMRAASAAPSHSASSRKAPQSRVGVPVVPCQPSNGRSKLRAGTRLSSRLYSPL